MRKIKLTIFIMLLLVSLIGLIGCNKKNNSDDKTISEVYFNLDTKKYIVTSDSDKYVTEYIKDKQYINLVIEIRANDGYVFSKDTKVYINSNLEEEHLSLSDDNKVITYKIKDPNWTPTY